MTDRPGEPTSAAPAPAAAAPTPSDPDATSPPVSEPAPSADLGRRRFFRAFAGELIQTAATVAGAAQALQRASADAASALLDLVEGIRAAPGVVSTEILTYLKLVKQTYTWGTR